VCGVWKRWSWDSLVIIVTRLWAGRRKHRDLTNCRKKIFFFQRFRTGSGAHIDSYSMSTRSPFPGTVRPGHEADHSPPPRPKAKTAWSCTSSPLCVHGVHKEHTILLETKNDSTVLIKINFMLTTTKRRGATNNEKITASNSGINLSCTCDVT
jgi:hypothetical protein